MNWANRINQLMAASIGTANAVLAIVVILSALASCITWFGWLVGIILGLLAGSAVAVGVCGVLAILVNIRDLLEESLRNRT